MGNQQPSVPEALVGTKVQRLRSESSTIISSESAQPQTDSAVGDDIVCHFLKKRWYRMNIKKLKSSELDSAVYAMVLGDGYITKPNKAGNCRIQFCHSLKNKKYLFWKKSILDQIGGCELKYYEDSYKNSKNGKIYKRCILYSNPNRYFRKIRDRIYVNGKKTLNEKILSKLTDLSLAILWQDDGCLTIASQKDYKGHFYSFVLPELAFCNFSEVENNLFIEWLSRKFGIESVIKIHKSNKKSDQIYIKLYSKTFKSFIDLIKPYVHSSMFYKIDLERIHSKNNAFPAKEKSLDTRSVIIEATDFTTKPNKRNY